MLSILMMSMILMALSVITMTIASVLSKKTSVDREKSSPFECGFDPSSSSRLPFSLRFFLIAIIFLIFDVEIALILPMIMIIQMSHLITWFVTSAIFILILILGLYHEWNQGALNWTT